MKATCQWKEKMQFTAQLDQFNVAMDTKPPIGSDTAVSPKQLLLAGICGCTAMDVVSLMRKFKQKLKSFQVTADAPVKTSHPPIFEYVNLNFLLEGDIDPAKAKEAVELSQTKYCAVSAMVSKVVPISYTIEINGKKIAEGKANFNI